MINVVIVAALLTCVPSSLAQAAPGRTIKLVKPPPGGELELGVGESYTFDILIKSDEPFVVAVTMTNEYYPDGISAAPSGGGLAITT